MQYILFNPLSCRGKSGKYLAKIERKLKRKHEEYRVFDVLQTPFSTLKEEISENDSLLLFGGDGTIHVLLNQIVKENLRVKVFVYKAGSGNDFFRDFKGRILEITDMIPNFPMIRYEGTEELFINGVGSGIDAAVCNAHQSGGDLGYLRQAVRLFKNFKQFSTQVTLDDGRVLTFNDTWFVTVQHGRFFGGGMKLSPKSRRDDKILEVCVIHKVKLRILLLIFPLIFLGWHLWFKRVGIEIIKTKKAIVKTEFPMLQRDGEVVMGVKTFEAFFKEN